MLSVALAVGDCCWRSSHYAVLALEEPVAGILDVATVRRRYKELVLRVHPDKNKHDDAEDAFKRLSAAYECLSNEKLQRAYIAQRRHKPKVPTHARGPPSRATKPRKKTRPPPPPKAPPPPPPGPRPTQTPEQVWSAFLREEEENARREFMAKGFEREYRQAGTKRPGTPPQEHHPRETVLDDSVDDRATAWTSWKRARLDTDATDTGTGSMKKNPQDLKSNDSVCCLLCRRKFPSADALTRHKHVSELHRTNLNRLHR